MRDSAKALKEIRAPNRRHRLSLAYTRTYSIFNCGERGTKN